MSATRESAGSYQGSAVQNDEILTAVRPAHAPEAGERLVAEKATPAPSQRAKAHAEAAEKGAEGTPLNAIGVIICGLARTDQGSAKLKGAIDSCSGAGRIVAVAREAAPSGADADGAKVDILELPEKSLTEGRARNAAYRRLKKDMANIRYVQFLSPDATLDPDWLREASRFLDRRPEVVVVSGMVDDESASSGSMSRLKVRALNKPSGEIETSRSMALVRADAFEAAGGFRGDLHGLEMDDLCIRLRRRGFHVWMLGARMARHGIRIKGLGDWLSEARADGYYYARSAALHGAGPEKFRVTERARAVVWGLAFPVFVVLAMAASAAGAAIFAPQSPPLLAAGFVLALGVMAYLSKIAIIAIRSGPGAPENWVYGALLVIGHFAEAGGVIKAWLSGKKKTTS